MSDFEHYTSIVYNHSRLDFRYRCSEKIERSGDETMDSHQHDEALKYYSTALSIHPANTPGFFILRGKVCMTKGLWEDAIEEAEQVRQFRLVQLHSCQHTIIRQLHSIHPHRGATR